MSLRPQLTLAPGETGAPVRGLRDVLLAGQRENARREMQTQARGGGTDLDMMNDVLVKYPHVRDWLRRCVMNLRMVGYGPATISFDRFILASAGLRKREKLWALKINPILCGFESLYTEELDSKFLYMLIPVDLPMRKPVEEICRQYCKLYDITYVGVEVAANDQFKLTAP